ncbi:hypothetical protein GV64_01730 [Endozoicomonas elysicola]|uniref:Peptidase M14 domain-containing protein n=1 Tax=Endozoicomonas elysicola TaxID=305900 RepID=A0A081K653_9GAMM|nr:hypothetical protein GV64_01730 [Endozoicomonas elysicola]
MSRQPSDNRFCYLIAGTHGDEPESVYVLEQLMHWFKDHKISFPMVIIPALNPDGFADGTRVNSNGVDLNRNLPASNWTRQQRDEKYSPGQHPASEPENQFLISLFEQYPPGFILSFHSWKPMLNSNGSCEEILQLLHQENAYPIVRDDIEGHPTPGSLGSYASEKLGIPVLTYECPVMNEKQTLHSIWQESENALVKLMQSGLIEKLL